jgi:hypothetical protein
MRVHLAIAVTLATYAALAGETISPIQWTVGRAARDEEPAHIQLSIGYPSTTGSGVGWTRGAVSLAELQGLTEAELNATAETNVRFRIVRDAGTLACSGSALRYRGTGQCRFLPNERFATVLEQRGIGSPTERQQFSLTIHDTGYALIEELVRQHYARPTLDEFVSAGSNGIDVDYLRAMDAAGYRFGDVRTLIRAQANSVSPQFVLDLKTRGYAHLSIDELITMRSKESR